MRYHGPKRTADPAVLASADVVLTTYSIAENEFRRFMQPGKVPCGYCNKKFYPERLKVHLRCAPRLLVITNPKLAAVVTSKPSILRAAAAAPRNYVWSASRCTLSARPGCCLPRPPRRGL